MAAAASPAMVAAKTEGGLYIGRRGARGLGEGAKPEAAAASCSRRTPAAWGRRRARAGRPGFGWASAQSGKRVIFFKNIFRGKYCIEK